MDGENSSDIAIGNQQESLETKVVCQLCKEEFWFINGRHLQTRHQIKTVKEYQEMFPDAPIYSPQYLLWHSNGAKGSGAKSTATKLLRYGTKTPNIEKWTLFEKGDKNPMHRKDVVEKCREGYLKTVTEKYGEGITNTMQVPEIKQKRKATILKNWGVEEIMHHPDIKRRARTQRKKGAMCKIEAILFSLAPDTLRYVGDSSYWVTIDGKLINPDFLVLPFEETKKVIEVYGEHWHYKDNPQDRIDLFKSIGIDCIVFWGRELYPKYKTENAIKRLQAFLKSSETECSAPNGDDIVRTSEESEELAEMTNLSDNEK